MMLATVRRKLYRLTSALRLFYVERRQLGEATRSEHRNRMQPNNLTIAVQRART